MIKFPVFERLDIYSYGLFPGPEESAPGLHVDFEPGLTLILGTNGLGKTTLVNILYRLLTGPYDIPGLIGTDTLGYTRIHPTRLPVRSRKQFADRVVDNARKAVAGLSFHLGQNHIRLERNLDELSLSKLMVDGQDLQPDNEAFFQETISKLAGVISFGDWVLLLRYLVFYFEDRRSLVWDPSAQRQFLRMLFLSTEVSTKWNKDERQILELDTRMRNLRAVVTREERALSKNKLKLEKGVDIRRELETLTNSQEEDTISYENLGTELTELDQRRHRARLRMLKAEQERESHYRKLEQVKLMAIASRFPSAPETAKYILAQILSNHQCLVCGNEVPQMATEYSLRLKHQNCIVCGSDLKPAESSSKTVINEHDKEVEEAFKSLEEANTNLKEATHTLKEAEQYFQLQVAEMTSINTRIRDRSRRIDLLIQQLPPEESDVHKQRKELTAMRGRLENMKTDLEALRASFRSFVEHVNLDIVKRKDAIKESFDECAEGFLLEQCHLVWSPQKTTVGQGGATIPFPAFEVDMTGADFPSPVRRSGPDQVSESQREFIDLAFRMALISVATHGGGSSLIMDAPESSLDAVFTSRAATVLCRFAKANPNNRLLITSNLIEGQLIPCLIKESTSAKGIQPKVVNLFEIAVPTAAVRKLRIEYETYLGSILPKQNEANS